MIHLYLQDKRMLLTFETKKIGLSAQAVLLEEKKLAHFHDQNLQSTNRLHVKHSGFLINKMPPFITEANLTLKRRLTTIVRN